MNATYRKILDVHVIEVSVCRNTDTKFAIVERFNRTLKSKLNKRFTRNNTYRYVDVSDKLVAGYNESVHLSTGMAPSLVSAYWRNRGNEDLEGRVSNYLSLGADCEDQ